MNGGADRCAITGVNAGAGVVRPTPVHGGFRGAFRPLIYGGAAAGRRMWQNLRSSWGNGAGVGSRGPVRLRSMVFPGFPLAAQLRWPALFSSTLAENASGAVRFGWRNAGLAVEGSR